MPVIFVVLFVQFDFFLLFFFQLLGYGACNHTNTTLITIFIVFIFCFSTITSPEILVQIVEYSFKKHLVLLSVFFYVTVASFCQSFSQWWWCPLLSKCKYCYSTSLFYRTVFTSAGPDSICLEHWVLQSKENIPVKYSDYKMEQRQNIKRKEKIKCFHFTCL